LTAPHACTTDGNLDNHAIAHHVDPDQCALAHCGQLLVFLNHARGQDVVSKLRAALEHGDTAYRDIPLFGTGRNLESLHSSLKADAGIQADKNTHMWRNYRSQVLAAEK
jgi:hypothetical protein